MAKRNIARTAIEGGRNGNCRRDEKIQDNKDKARTRQYLHSLLLSDEYDDDERTGGKPQGGWNVGRRYREFDDKLNPIKRWLAKQVGRPWEKVYSQICKTFDPSSLAGRHILDHIKNYVQNKPTDNIYDFSKYVEVWREPKRFPGTLYVDKKGFLRQTPLTAKKKYRYY